MTRIGDMMNRNPITLRESATAAEAAKAMRENDIGAVLVSKSDDSLCGIVTDRDLVVRCLGGSGDNPREMAVGDICSHDVTSLEPDTTVDDAIRMMREHALRRIPVLDGGRPVGILSLGDLAIARDPDSVLGQVSAAPANR